MSAARALGLTAVVPEIKGSEDVGGAIQALANERVDVVIVLESTLLLSLRRQIAEVMAANRLPAVYGYRDHVDEGGLISYGCWRRAATYVHRILNGAAPADLPVEFAVSTPAEASSPDERCETCLGRDEINPGCCYADPGNVDWSRWMPSHPPL